MIMYHPPTPRSARHPLTPSPTPHPPIQMGKDYIYAVVPLLEDALMDRDLVHRQTACTTVKHLALGCAGLGYVRIRMCVLGWLWWVWKLMAM